jgi:hypothetical protein
VALGDFIPEQEKVQIKVLHATMMLWVLGHLHSRLVVHQHKRWTSRSIA